MFKNILRLWLPPIITDAIRQLRILYFDRPNVVFEGDDSLFKNEVSSVDIYGEYGCGKSTKWVLNNTDAQVIAVDTSSDWVDAVKNNNRINNDRLNIYHCNLGAVGGWGRPLNYDYKDSFADYTDYLWNQKENPQLILVDGRFRVCCFLTCLKFAKEGTKIIFDDYTNRPFYHFVEKYVPRIKECGRQCLFIVPDKSEIDMDELNCDIAAFRNVTD